MRYSSLGGVALVIALLVSCRPEGSPDASAPGAAPRAPERKATATPPPTPEPVVLAEGTKIPLALETSVSSGKSTAGELVVAKVTADVKEGERVVVPAGSEARGKVVKAVSSGRVKGKAQLVVAFDHLVVKGESHPIEATRIDITAGSQKKKDAAIIGGGAAAGAIVGGIADGGKGAGIGAIIGGVAGTGAVLATKGKEVTLPAGTAVTIRLTKSATLP